MRSIDFLALGCAVLSLLSFLSSSSSFQTGQATLGTFKLLVGAAALIIGILSGVASIGTDGYRPLTSNRDLFATATVSSRAGDSLTARVTWPDGITRTFRLGGTRVRFDVRVLRWRFGGEVIGAPESWEFAGLAAEYRDGQTAAGSVRNVQLRRPITVYDLVLSYPALTAVVEAELMSIELPANGAETGLYVSSDGLATGN
ncbi:MAG: hypothetical protein OEU54_09790 [Gemmatimonadota bacterium]|nr:hypothetical protein [Gemmatimonadota bacterium]